MTERLTRFRFQHRGRRYSAVLVERPFREGGEMRFLVDGREVNVADLGLGKRALVAKAKHLIDSLQNASPR
ncbi:MAG: hypothetical protein K1X83_06030 [Oligoflexia bacterium]|nr:hypothetical protein [Oligoflexia bacterium]